MSPKTVWEFECRHCGSPTEVLVDQADLTTGAPGAGAVLEQFTYRKREEEDGKKWKLKCCTCSRRKRKLENAELLIERLNRSV